MPTVLIKPAAQLAITLAEAKDNLRISGARMDAQVQLWIRGVTRHAEGLMRRSIMSQDWLLIADGFAGIGKLQNPPIIEVMSVEYFDAGNVLQTLEPASYLLADRSLLPTGNATWPSTFARPDAVRIKYTSGFGETAESTPPDIKLYLLAKLAEQFDPAASDKQSVQSSYIDGLLSDYVVYD